MPHTYNWLNIRNLLTKGFTAEQLRSFCFDSSEFRAVYDELNNQTGKRQIVALLLEYADQNRRVDELLAWTNQLNPRRYEIHQPYVNDSVNKSSSPRDAASDGDDEAIVSILPEQQIALDRGGKGAGGIPAGRRNIKPGTSQRQMSFRQKAVLVDALLACQSISTKLWGWLTRHTFCLGGIAFFFVIVITTLFFQPLRCLLEIRLTEAKVALIAILLTAIGVMFKSTPSHIWRAIQYIYGGGALALLTLVMRIMILPPPSPIECLSCSLERSVRLQVEGTKGSIPDARVTIEVDGETILNTKTNADGLATFCIPVTYEGLAGQLQIEQPPGSLIYEEPILLTENDILTDVYIFATPITPTSTTTLTPTNTSPSTITPTTPPTGTGTLCASPHPPITGIDIPGSVTITNLLDSDCIVVNQDVTVIVDWTGLPENYYLWLLVYSPIAERYYPFTPGESPFPINGRRERKVMFSRLETYEVIVIVADQAAHDFLLQNQTGNGIKQQDLPKGIKEKDNRLVIRQE